MRAGLDACRQAELPAAHCFAIWLADFRLRGELRMSALRGAHRVFVGMMDVAGTVAIATSTSPISRMALSQTKNRSCHKGATYQNLFQAGRIPEGSQEPVNHSGPAFGNPPPSKKEKSSR